MRKNSPIGVFDSGFGGIAILKHIVRALPQYDYVYFGDTARTPYGTRSSEVVYQFTKEGIEFLFSKGCDFVILACNTASSEALRKIQREWLPKKFPTKKVLGVLIPAAEEAVSKTKNERIGILATTGTVRSESFVREIKKFNAKIRVFQSAAPLLVPFIEAGEEKSLAAEIMVQKYLAPLIRNRVDTVVLGCTHYGIIESLIQQNCGGNIRVLNEGPVVAKKLKTYFTRQKEIEKKITKNKKIIFYTSDDAGIFEKFGSRFFGKKIRGEKVVL